MTVGDTQVDNTNFEILMIKVAVHIFKVFFCKSLCNSGDSYPTLYSPLGHLTLFLVSVIKITVAFLKIRDNI